MSDDSLQAIVCCMGQPVAGNPTQFMIERAFAAAGLDWRYLTLEVAPDDLAAGVAGMQAGNKDLERLRDEAERHLSK